MSWNWPIWIWFHSDFYFWKLFLDYRLKYSSVSSFSFFFRDSNYYNIGFLFLCPLHWSLLLQSFLLLFLFTFLASHAFLQCSLIIFQLNQFSLEYLVISSSRWLCVYSSNSFLSSLNSCFLPFCFVLLLHISDLSFETSHLRCFF